MHSSKYKCLNLYFITYLSFILLRVSFILRVIFPKNMMHKMHSPNSTLVIFFIILNRNRFTFDKKKFNVSKCLNNCYIVNVLGILCLSLPEPRWEQVNSKLLSLL